MSNREDTGDGWSHEVYVTCGNSTQHVLNHRDISPNNITSITRMSYPSAVDDYTVLPSLHYTKESWKKMGDTLSETTVLVELSLPCSGLGRDNADALFGGGRTFHWPALRTLYLRGNHFGLAGMQKITPILKSSLSTLDELNLISNSLGAAAAKLVAGVLDRIQIKCLKLGHNSIKNEGLESILSSRNARHLVELDVWGNNQDFTDHAFEVLYHFICRDDTELKRLSVNFGNNYNSTRVKMLIDSISNKSKLEEISSLPNPWLEQNDLWDRVLKLVCNTSSLQSLCDSNHRLCSFSRCSSLDRTPLSKESSLQNCNKLSMLFEINQERNERGSTSNQIL